MPLRGSLARRLVVPPRGLTSRDSSVMGGVLLAPKAAALSAPVRTQLTIEAAEGERGRREGGRGACGIQAAHRPAKPCPPRCVSGGHVKRWGGQRLWDSRWGERKMSAGNGRGGQRFGRRHAGNGAVLDRGSLATQAGAVGRSGGAAGDVVAGVGVAGGCSSAPTASSISARRNVRSRVTSRGQWAWTARRCASCPSAGWARSA
jgi:hypothetical protein